MKSLCSKRLLALLTLGFLVSGCFDHRRRVALSTFVRDDGRFDQTTYAAALKARFPSGTPVADLQKYVKLSGGNCHATGVGHLHCQIPLRGAICWAELAGIDVVLNDSRVSEITVQVGGMSC